MKVPSNITRWLGKGWCCWEGLDRRSRVSHKFVICATTLRNIFKISNCSSASNPRFSSSFLLITFRFSHSFFSFHVMCFHHLFLRNKTHISLQNTLYLESQHTWQLKNKRGSFELLVHFHGCRMLKLVP